MALRIGPIESYRNVSGSIGPVALAGFFYPLNEPERVGVKLPVANPCRRERRRLPLPMKPGPEGLFCTTRDIHGRAPILRDDYTRNGSSEVTHSTKVSGKWLRKNLDYATSDRLGKQSKIIRQTRSGLETSNERLYSWDQPDAKVEY